MTTTLDDVLAYLGDVEDLRTLDRITSALDMRRPAVLDVERKKRAAALTVGSTVTLVDITPKFLAGLRGEVTELADSRARVRLDEVSTKQLRWERSKRFAVPADMTHFVFRVPRSCAQTIDDSPS